jgi:hypothetical protein
VRLVSVVRAPERPEEAAEALAEAAGLALAEARMRLAPEAPALVARLDPERADALVVALRRAGLAAIAVDADVPDDRDRLVARSFALGPEGPVSTSRAGKVMAVAWPDVRAVLRGARAARTETQHTARSKTFSATRALATGGIVSTRTAERTVRSSDETMEQVVLVYARDGRAAIFAEGQVDFACLGAAKQPSATANMAELARRLRDGAKGAFYDERLLRLGRRPLPLVASDGGSSRTASTVTRRTDTSASLDVLAEVMWRALLLGLLP